MLSSYYFSLSCLQLYVSVLFRWNSINWVIISPSIYEVILKSFWILAISRKIILRLGSSMINSIDSTQGKYVWSKRCVKWNTICIDSLKPMMFKEWSELDGNKFQFSNRQTEENVQICNVEISHFLNTFSASTFIWEQLWINIRYLMLSSKDA